jgi:hypothetical protein
MTRGWRPVPNHINAAASDLRYSKAFAKRLGHLNAAMRAAPKIPSAVLWRCAMQRTDLFAFAAATVLAAVWTASAWAQNTQQQNPPAQTQQQPPAQTQQQVPAQTQQRTPAQTQQQVPAQTQQQVPAQNQQQVPAQSQAPGRGQVPAQNQVQDRAGTAQQQARQLQGRVLRTAEGSFVIRTPDNREVTVYTNPRTTYRANNRDVRFSDVRVGSDITIGYDLNGNRYFANNVVVGPAEQVPAQPVAEGTLVTGRVVRVVGADQVILQTTDGREVPVYVTPQTVYQLAPAGGAFTDLRPGIDIGVYYDARDNRFLARRIARRATR